MPANYTNFVQQLYQKLLGRPPSSAELNSAVTGLISGTQNAYGVLYSVYTGQEFRNTGAFRAASDHSNALYVRMLYFLVLQRDPDPGGLAFWLGIANGGGSGIYFNGSSTTATRVLMLGPGDPGVGFIGSPEFQGRFQ